MTGLSQRRAFFFSLLAHAALWAVLLRFESREAQARVTREQTAAATQHLPALRRNQAELDADRLRHIRELSERLAHSNGRGDSAPGPAQETSATPISRRGETPTTDAPHNLDALYEQSRRDYAAARERFMDAEARRLAKITGQNIETARQAVEAGQPKFKTAVGSQTGQGAGAPRGGAQAGKTSKMEWMQADAQRMLGRALAAEKTDRDGPTLAVESQRDAYRLLNNSQQFATETKEFEPVVDWTALMGHPLAVSSGYGGGDSGPIDGEYRHVEPAAERALRTSFNHRTEPLRFTRHIGHRGTERGGWVCPDSWYIVGPFDNPNRSAIDQTFPPEVELDRDAVYTGKNGRPIAWEFVRVRQVAVIPPHPEEYAVYYAYTEVRADEAMDCWLALGSDDHSKLWVNDLLVWSDTRNEKTWSATEGFRRVHLDAGVNRLLLRLENGWRGTMFSLALELP